MFLSKLLIVPLFMNEAAVRGVGTCYYRMPPDKSVWKPQSAIFQVVVFARRCSGFKWMTWHLGDWWVKIINFARSPSKLLQQGLREISRNYCDPAYCDYSAWWSVLAHSLPADGCWEIQCCTTVATALWCQHPIWALVSVQTWNPRQVEAGPWHSIC